MSQGRRSQPLPPQWSKLRQQILTRDNHTCTECGQPGTHVDHVTPAHLGGPDTPDNLTTLCSRCHDSKTGREANAARRPTRRPAEPHPGELHPQ